MIKESTALVTGANRGIGRAFVDGLLARGARRVYAAARDASGVRKDDRVVSVELDITDPESVRRAAGLADDVDLLVNNAGITRWTTLIGSDEADARAEMETNFFGTLSMARAFAPVLARHGGGTMLNVLSAMVWVGAAHSNGYGASKAAAWSMTNGLRVELADQGTQVTGLVMSGVDTESVAHLDIPKTSPGDLVAIALDGLEDGLLEITADDTVRALKAALSQDPALLYPQAARHVATV